MKTKLRVKSVSELPRHTGGFDNHFVWAMRVMQGQSCKGSHKWAKWRHDDTADGRHHPNSSCCLRRILKWTRCRHRIGGW